MALDRIRKKISKGRLGDSAGKSREEIEEILNMARRFSVERAARQFGVREGQIIQWMRQGIPVMIGQNERETNGRTVSNVSIILN